MGEQGKAGSLIVFEGIDGVGKTTQVRRAANYLCSVLGPEKLIVTEEPGGTSLGSGIRRLMFEEVGTGDLAPGVVDLMFLASHVQHCGKLVVPSLLHGKTVLSDRFWYSQFAYSSQRVVPDSIRQAYEACRGPQADLLIFLWANPTEVLPRATHGRKKAWADATTMGLIQREYFELFKDFQEFCPVKADGSEEEVWERVRQELDKFLKVAGPIPLAPTTRGSTS